MADTLDLTGSIQAGIDEAAVRGHTVVWGYVDDDGYAAMSFRGSTLVFIPTQLALWARKRDDGIVRAIAERPKVTALFYEPNGPGPRFLSIRGTARADESANDTVYERMVEMERQRDPDRGGIAVILDVESVNGFGAEGPFQMTRD